MVYMPPPPSPPVHRCPCSPSLSSNSDGPLPTRRRLFSTPLQPPLVSVPPLPHNTLSFKINSRVASFNIPVPPPLHCALSFKINDGSTSDLGSGMHASACLDPSLSCSNLPSAMSSRSHSTSSYHPICPLNNSTESIQMGTHPSLPSATPHISDQEDRESSTRGGEEVLQDYCQQVLLSDGLQRINKWMYVVLDWNEVLGVLEVSPFIPPLPIQANYDVQPTRFYHLRSLPTSETIISFVCDCPNRRPQGCIHIHLFKAHAHHFHLIQPFSSTPHPPAFLITHSLTLGNFIFSVCSTRSAGLTSGK